MSCEPADRLLQSLIVHAPGATEEMIRLELFNVMDEFFRRTSAWRYPAEVTLEETVLEYPLPVPENSLYVRMIGVTHNDIPVPQAPAPGVSGSSVGRLSADLTFPDGDTLIHPDASDMSGSIFTWAIYRPGYLTVTAAPTEDKIQYPLKMVMVLTVARSCLECDCDTWSVDEWMWDMFFQDWYDGVLGRLYLMPNKPWSSEKMGPYHAKRFRNAMAFRKQEANRGFVYGVPGFRFPKQGGWVR